MPSQPSGIVTFLFTDVEGSTLLWEANREAMRVALAEHDRLIQVAAEDEGGYVFSTAGDAFAIAFQDPVDAIRAALKAQFALQSARFESLGRIRVRMAIHSGTAEERDGNYFGPTLNRCARILSIASGDEALVSSATEERLDGGLPAGTGLTDIGEFRLKDLGRSNRVFRLTHPDLVDVDASRDPERIRGYDVTERIGEGGFGVVYRARQAGVEREVAVKAVRPQFANNSEFIRRFDAEAQLVARLEHPFIVPLYDYWREPSGAFLVMRWLKGGSLEASLGLGPWSLEASLGLIRQVGDALAAAHRLGVVHRDIKPANILLDTDGNAYLSDFGIAADLAAAIQLDALDQSTDWPAYASPELLMREQATPRADIYSLGLVLYELLTGEYPFGEAIPSELLERQLHEDTTPIDQMRPELSADVARVISTATSRDPARRHASVGDLVRDFEIAVSGEPTVALGGEHVRNPYKGLAAFQQSDAGDFFGRSALIEQIIDVLTEHRLVAIVGPSGSGKSSVVKAGLLPALQGGEGNIGDGCFFTEMVPATSPFEELEAALLRVAVDPPATLLEQLRGDAGGLARAVKRVLPPGEEELVLVIDQFEEVFSLVPDVEARRRFLDSLLRAVDNHRNRLRVVLTLRADFFDQPLLHPDFAEALTAGLVTVTPLSGEELEHAIVEPGRRVGVSFEPGLVGDMVTEVSDQAGALPLLQYALTELFERRVEATLSRTEYRALGGVAGALGRRAEEVYSGLDRQAREVARQVFLRLVTLGEGTGDTRRRVTRAELDALSGDRGMTDTVLEAFGGQRLIAFDRDPVHRTPTVEVAHEALLREWTRLREWIDGGRADVRVQRRLAAAAADWEEADRDTSFLLTGVRLEQAEILMAAADVALTDQEVAFIGASLARRTSEQATEETRRERERVLERRSVLRLRVLVGVLAVATLAAGSLSFFAFDQRSEARTQARQAQAQGLAIAAAADVESDPELTVLLALEGAAISRDADEEVIPEIVDALHAGLARMRTTLVVEDSTAGGFSVDGSEIVLGRGPEALVLDVSSGEVRRRLVGHDGAVTQATFSPDGSLIATASEDGSVRIWDAESGLFLRRLAGHDGTVTGVAFSPDSTRVASWGEDDAARIWEVGTGEPGPRFQALDFVASVAWSPDSTLLAVSGPSFAIIDTATGDRVLTDLDTSDGTAGLAFSPDGATLAMGLVDGTVELWDLETAPQAEEPVGSWSGHTDVVLGVAFDSMGHHLVTAGDDGQVLVRDVETGDVEVSVPGHAAGVRWIDLSPDDASVLSTGRDGISRITDVSPGGSREWLTLEAGVPLQGVTISPDGSQVLAFSREGEGAYRWDVTDPSLGVPVALPEQITEADLQGGWVNDHWTRTFGVTQTLEVVAWDRETWEEIGRVVPERDLGWVSVTPDGSLLANVTALEVQVHDVESGEIIRRWPSEIDADGDMPVGAFSPDASLFAVGSGGGIVNLWDAGTGELVLQKQLPDGPIVRSVVFASDSSWMAVSASDATIRMWDLPSGDDRGDVLTHGGDVLGLAVSSDDSWLATGSTDGTVRVWDLSDPGSVLGLGGHRGGVSGVAFHPDGDRLYTSSQDGTVRVHALEVDDLVALAEERVTRPLTAAECTRYSLGCS